MNENKIIDFGKVSLCRCCHAEGNFRSLNSTLPSEFGSNILEMLRQTLQVDIKPLSANFGENMYNICPLCVWRLQDAIEFKKQVVMCEKKLQSSIKGAEFSQNVMVEIEKEEPNSSNIQEKDPNEKLPLNQEYNEARAEFVEEEQNSSHTQEKDTNDKFTEPTPPKVQENKSREEYSCEICEKKFTRKILLQKHLKKHRTETEQCKLCDVTRLKDKAIKYKGHKVDGRYICTICINDFDNLNLFKIHLKTHSNNIFKCDHCGKEYIKKRSLINHLQLHTKKFVGDNKELKMHMNVHTKDCHTCVFCKKEFNIKSELKNHYKLDHSELKQTYKCDVCGKEYLNKSSLANHVKTHNGQSYECDFCKKSFMDLDVLKVHIRVHVGEKKYTCSYCGQMFVDISNYKMHERRHRGDKPFKCTVCSKGFVKNYALKVHMTTHSGEKPYPCDLCGKSFATKDRVTYHSRVHTGAKKFTCKICSKTVRSISEHMKARHPDEQRNKRDIVKI